MTTCPRDYSTMKEIRKIYVSIVKNTTEIQYNLLNYNSAIVKTMLFWFTLVTLVNYSLL